MFTPLSPLEKKMDDMILEMQKMRLNMEMSIVLLTVVASHFDAERTVAVLQKYKEDLNKKGT
jgi:hypothetical protein